MAIARRNLESNMNDSGSIMIADWKERAGYCPRPVRAGLKVGKSMGNYMSN